MFKIGTVVEIQNSKSKSDWNGLQGTVVADPWNDSCSVLVKVPSAKGGHGGQTYDGRTEDCWYFMDEELKVIFQPKEDN